MGPAWRQRRQRCGEGVVRLDLIADNVANANTVRSTSAKNVHA